MPPTSSCHNGRPRPYQHVLLFFGAHTTRQQALGVCYPDFRHRPVHCKYRWNVGNADVDLHVSGLTSHITSRRGKRRTNPGGQLEISFFLLPLDKVQGYTDTDQRYHFVGKRGTPCAKSFYVCMAADNRVCRRFAAIVIGSFEACFKESPTKQEIFGVCTVGKFLRRPKFFQTSPRMKEHLFVCTQ